MGDPGQQEERGRQDQCHRESPIQDPRDEFVEAPESPGKERRDARSDDDQEKRKACVIPQCPHELIPGLGRNRYHRAEKEIEPERPQGPSQGHDEQQGTTTRQRTTGDRHQRSIR